MTTTDNNPDLQVIPEETFTMSPLIKIIKKDMQLILELYEPYEEQLTDIEKKYMDQLQRCVLILEEK